MAGSSSVTFTDVGRSSGITFRHAASKTTVKFLPETMGGGVAMFDADGDGRLDLFFTNGAALTPDTTPARPPQKGEPRFWNRLYRNLGDWKFEDVTERSGLAGTRYDFGAAVADYDNDGDVDLHMTGLGRNTLYRNSGNGTFTDVTLPAGAVVPGWSSSAAFVDYDHDVGRITIQNSGWGTKFVDFDNDTRRDLFVAQGHVLDTVSRARQGFDYLQPPLMLRNAAALFVDASASLGPTFGRPAAGRGAAFGDVDDDGDIDIVIANLDTEPTVLRNDGGNANHWITVSLRGTQSNRDGIGAVVGIVDDKGRSQSAICSTASSYQSGNDRRVHFGLADGNLRRIEVRWPSGKVQTLTDVAGNRHLEITEPSAPQASARYRPASDPAAATGGKR